MRKWLAPVQYQAHCPFSKAEDPSVQSLFYALRLTRYMDLKSAQFNNAANSPSGITKLDTFSSPGVTTISYDTRPSTQL